MTANKAFFIIKATLEKIGFSACRPLPAGMRGPAVFDGKIQVGHKTVDVRVDIPDVRLVDHPRVYLLDQTQVPSELVSHLEQSDGICYSNPGLLRLDSYDPGGSVLRVIEKVKNTLSLSLKGQAPAEIAEEFAQYWGEASIAIMTTADSDKAIRFALHTNPKGRPSFLALGLKDPIPDEYKAGGQSYLYRTDTLLVPSETFVTPNSLLLFEKWYRFQGLSNRVAWRRVRDRLLSGEIVFIAAPNAIVGVSADLPIDLKALKKKAGSIRPDVVESAYRKRPDQFDLKRYGGFRADLRSTVERSLPAGQGSLIDKNILLIGCGTIGSYLARVLVQMGAGCGGQLELIDPEVLSIGNIGRHLLDFGSVDLSKATALGDQLSKFHPQVQIRTHAASIFDRSGLLKRVDLIVDATGVEILSEQLNRLKLEDETIPTIIHAWLFANGIAAQSFANTGGQHAACYRCLRPKLDAPWRFDPRKDVTDAGSFVRGTCGDGVFLPYGVFASTQAAALCAQMVGDWASGNLGPTLRTRVIDSIKAKALKDSTPSNSEQCPACGG